MMKVTDEEILFIYDSRDIMAREALGYASTLRHHKVKERDVWTDMLTESQLAALADLLDISPKELIDEQSQPYQEEFADAKMTEADWLKTIIRNPAMLKTPVVRHSQGAQFINTPKALIALDLKLQNTEEPHTDPSIYQESQK